MTVQTAFAVSLSLSIGGSAGHVPIKILSGTRTGNSSLIAGVLLRLTKNRFSFAWPALPPPFACVSIRRVDLKRLGVTLTLESGLGVRHGRVLHLQLLTRLGAGPRRDPRARTSSDGGLHEELSHHGPAQSWDCPPRRHREDATGVVVAFHRGHDSAVGQNFGRKNNHRMGRITKIQK